MSRTLRTAISSGDMPGFGVVVAVAASEVVVGAGAVVSTAGTVVVSGVASSDLHDAAVRASAAATAMKPAVVRPVRRAGFAAAPPRAGAGRPRSARRAGP